MKARELAAILMAHPDADVAYKNMNFPGKDHNAFEDDDIHYDATECAFLVESPYWELVD